jgi:hypothetical protein
MIKMIAVALASALFATPAVAAPVKWEMVYNAGDPINLNEGFYLCKANPGDLMTRLLAIRGIGARRSVASKRGCAFLASNTLRPARVVETVSSACLDSHMDEEFDTDLRKIVSIKLCGREGHHFVVQGRSGTIHVIWLSLDMDYD